MINSAISDNSVIDMKFCRVFWKISEDFPSLVLIPRKAALCTLSQLTMEERLQLMREISLCEEVIQELVMFNKICIFLEEEKDKQLSVHIEFAKEEVFYSFGEEQKNSFDEAKINKFVSDVKRAIMIKMADNRFCQH